MDNTYDNFGRLSSSTIKNSTAEAVKMTYSFLDASSVRTTNLLSGYNVYVGGSGTPKYSYQYTYDPSGNVTKVVDSSTNRTVNYTYDKLNQLTSVSNYDNLGIKDKCIVDNRGNITEMKSIFLKIASFIAHFDGFEFMYQNNAYAMYILFFALSVSAIKGYLSFIYGIKKSEKKDKYIRKEYNIF